MSAVDVDGFDQSTAHSCVMTIDGFTHTSKHVDCAKSTLTEWDEHGRRHEGKGQDSFCGTSSGDGQQASPKLHDGTYPPVRCVEYTAKKEMFFGWS